MMIALHSQPKYIIVIEPSYAHFRWISFLFRQRCGSVELVRFETALGALQTLSATHAPNTILMSWRLPIMRAADALAALRRTYAQRAVPIVALVNGEAQKRHALECGVAALSSPLTQDGCKAVLQLLKHRAKETSWEVDSEERLCRR